MLEKRVNDQVFLTHKFFALLETIRFALDVDNGTVMQDTVKDSGGNGDVGKDLVPLREGLIVSAPMIKCKKVAGKKCNNMAGRRKKR